MGQLATPNSAHPGAVGEDEAERVRLAARPSTPPALLRLLADDAAVTVRAAVAMNPAYAHAAICRLAGDSDDRVRMLLANKVARLLPELGRPEQRAAQAHVHRTLLALANDAAVRVRVVLAEALTSLPDAPRAVILKLAADPILTVSEPVLRLSPLLNDADLLSLLATPAHPGTAKAVAARAQLGADVADRIAHHADSAAVRVLLQNHSAQIRETTLDALAGRAGDHPEWHEPLAKRPALPERSILALSRFVAHGIIAVLVARPDIPPHVGAELRARLGSALDGAPPPSEADILDGVRRLNGTGQLTEAALVEAAAVGDNRQVAAILAVASGVTLQVLDRAVGLRSAKALISLVWKAGFSMRAAQAVQATLGRLSPGELLHATTQGAYPLSGDEMEWQIELLADPGA